MALTIEQAYKLATEQGFTGDSAIKIVAIGIAESGLEEHGPDGINDPTDGCPDGSRDRGILQINDCYHPEVSDDQAYHAASAFAAGLRISDGGTNFHPWATFNTQRYLTAYIKVKAIVQPERIDTVSIEVPEQWIHDVSAATGVTDPLAVTPPPVVRNYTVVSGDTLSGIAQQLTGDATRWEELYQENKAIIGDNPDLILPNQVFTIPANWP